MRKLLILVMLCLYRLLVNPKLLNPSTMSWHTPHAQTTTQQPSWHYHAHIVAPIELILNYEVKTLYLLKTAFATKPKHPV